PLRRTPLRRTPLRRTPLRTAGSTPDAWRPRTSRCRDRFAAGPRPARTATVAGARRNRDLPAPR
ncbi:MAG: hypothetical protein ACRDT6_29125, partial [Micromonosporaceae bacterium]